MNVLDRTIGFFSPVAGVRRAQARQVLAATKRAYDAGRPSRTTAGWRRPFTSARSETYAGLPYLRASSHDVVRNNPHAAKIIASLAYDAIGTGIMPRAKTGRKALNKKVDAFAADFFAEMDADSITKNYAGFQILAARALFEGGEGVIRKYVRPASMGLAVPLQYALMEGEFIDNSKNYALDGGNRVVQGIEFDPVTRARVAYHMFKEHPGDTYMGALEGSFETVRVPAADVRIMMEPQRPGQIRGVPWITPILVRAKLLDDYEDAERQRKRIESSVPAVVKSSNATGDASEANSGPSMFPTLVDAHGNLVEEIEAGLVAYLRDGTDIEFMSPADAASFAPYKRAELQSMAAGARSTYELASGDLSQTSFSSIQFGTLSYRGMMDVVRKTIIIPDLEWIWRGMIDMGVAMGRLPADTPYGVEHHCPPWLPIDPDKAASANKTMIRTGEKSLYEVVTARGKDFDEHMAEVARSNKLLDQLGLMFDSDPRRTDGRGVDQTIAADVKGDVPAQADAKPAEDKPAAGDGAEPTGDDAEQTDPPPEA